MEPICRGGYNVGFWFRAHNRLVSLRRVRGVLNSMLVEYSTNGTDWVVVHTDSTPYWITDVIFESGLNTVQFTAFNAEPPPSYWQNFFGQYEAP